MRRLLILSSALFLCGCAFFSSSADLLKDDPGPARVRIPDVPLYTQTAHQCGPAALAMVLGWSGSQVGPDDLTPQVYTPGRKGSLQSSIITAARRHQRLAYVIRGRRNLIAELAAGHPVLILQNLGIRWLPRWHYAVVVGYDRSPAQVVLHSGQKAVHIVGFKTFEHTWKRSDSWGLVVLPPNIMPASAEEQPYLQAALGLQSAGQTAAAVVAFQSAAQRWPHSATVCFALGNALYGQGDIEGSVQAFSHATELDPNDGSAWNNLAHVLAELGRLDLAETAARRAVFLDGVLGDAARQTLEEILLKKRSANH